MAGTSGTVRPVNDNDTTWGTTANPFKVDIQTQTLSMLQAFVTGDAAGQAIATTLTKAWDYETVAASQTDQAIGASAVATLWGSAVIVNTHATLVATVTFKDGASTILTAKILASTTIQITWPAPGLECGTSLLVTTDANSTVLVGYRQ